MRRREFIDIILNSISDTFDIYHNYWFEGRKFVIYAYSYNKKDRFSTTDDAKLWDSKCYEHLFFINCDTLGMKELDDLYPDGAHIDGGAVGIRRLQRRFR